MDAEKMLTTMSRRAAGEMPPPVDVADGVTRAIRARQTLTGVDPGRPLAWIAALSLAGAAPAAVALVFVGWVMTNPLTPLVGFLGWGW